MTDQTETINGAEAMVKLLDGYDVTHLFGLCGDTTLPFYDALYRLDHGIQHILTRDERCAAYMADGYARVTGKPGVCEGPSGGGATHILPGVVEANESSGSGTIHHIRCRSILRRQIPTHRTGSGRIIQPAHKMERCD